MAVTTTEETYGAVKKVTFDWTTDGSGDATGTTVNAYTGKVLQVTTIPGAVTPTASYDVTVVDQDSVDLCLGNGANRANNATEYIKETSAGVVANDTLTVAVANGGAAKTGTVIVSLR